MIFPTKKLGEVCVMQNGFAFKSSEYVNSGFFVMRIANVQDGYISHSDPKYIDKHRENEFSRFILNAGDILMSLTGNVGRVGIIEPSHLPAVLNQRVARIKLTEGIDNKYLYFLLLSPYFIEKVIGKGHGMAQMNVSTRDIENFEIPLPPLEIQKKVVKKIEELFAKIAQAQSLRESATGDTDDLIPATLSKIFEEGRSKGWKDRELGELCDLNPRNDIKGLSDDTEVSFIPMKYVDDIHGLVSQMDVRKLIEVKKGYTGFKSDDVIFAKITPCMENGKAAIVRSLKKGIGFGSTEFHVLRSKGDILPELIYYYIRRKSFRDEAEKRMTGSAGQKRVPKEFLERSTIPLPPIAEQKRIVARMNALTQKVRELQALQSQTARDLSALKQSILHQAFRGEL